jgi:hypothetical protein
MSRTTGNSDEVNERFSEGLSARWTRLTPNGGAVDVGAEGVRLSFPNGAQAGHYTNAQIDDYGFRPPLRFRWQAPLHLEVRARASHPAHPTRSMPPDQAEDQQWLRGTAGFGFWNHPFTVTGVSLRLPKAVWFFAASPPSDMALVPGSPGWGWKAQVVHTHRPGLALSAAPTAAAMAWAMVSRQEGMASRWVQRLSGTVEAPLDADLRVWHTYTIDWRTDRARFAVDGVEALSVANPPRGPLGFVAWIDNQYAIVTPRGRFRFGTLIAGPQWLEIESLRILPGANGARL